jgi:hypothetical protein
MNSQNRERKFLTVVLPVAIVIGLVVVGTAISESNMANALIAVAFGSGVIVMIAILVIIWRRR